MASLLLDAGRVVALNDYAEELRLLPFLSRSFHREEELLIATKRVHYGSKKRTRLHSLARKGDLARVRLLLKVGADVNAKDEGGRTPLRYAAEKGHESVVRYLAAEGTHKQRA